MPESRFPSVRTFLTLVERAVVAAESVVRSLEATAHPQHSASADYSAGPRFLPADDAVGRENAQLWARVENLNSHLDRAIVERFQAVRERDEIAQRLEAVENAYAEAVASRGVSAGRMLDLIDNAASAAAAPEPEPDHEHSWQIGHDVEVGPLYRCTECNACRPLGAMA